MQTRRRRFLLWAVPAGVVVVGGALALSGTFRGAQDEEAGAFATVARGPLVISVTESGTIKNREQVVIKSEVEGRTAILTLVKEGQWVKPGDLLVELDSSRLEEQKAGQQITVINTEANFIRARENLAVVKSQAESDVSKADLDLRFARLDLEKYVQGEYPQQLRQAEVEITIAREQVERAAEKAEWSRKLHEQRYLSRMDLQADELALETAKLDLELAEGRKKLLEEYTHRRDLEALQSAIEQAESALDRSQRKAAADTVQAESDLRAKESEYQRQKAQLDKIEDQIRKCRIIAPRDGMVVYATTGRGGWRGNDEPLEEGQEVRERQELIYLPTAASMMAEVKIHESSLEKVRVGLPVRVTVDAAPGRSWGGSVQRIAVLPDAQSVWLNPDLKLYNSEIHLDGDASDLRTGMSCRAEIFVAQYDDALYIPVQCVVRVAGRPTVYVRSDGASVARPVKIGLDNNRFVHVLEGLEKGERVLLDPPLEGASPAPAEAPPEIPPPQPEEPGSKPENAQGAASGSFDFSSVDWSDPKARAEAMQRFRDLPAEEQAKLREQMRSRMGGRGGERGGPGGGQGAER